MIASQPHSPGLPDEVSQDEAGRRRLFRHSPETPGSIHEGGELGYSLAHAFGAAFDNPNLIVAWVWSP